MNTLTTDLLTEFEQIEAELKKLNRRKKELREQIYRNLVESGIEETTAITETGTKFVIRIQKSRREKVNITLLRAELGEKADRYITVTESEFLSIRPAKKTLEELKEVTDGEDDITF